MVATPKSLIYRWIFPCKPSSYGGYSHDYGSLHLDRIFFWGGISSVEFEIWLVVWNINFIFPYIGFLIIPIDFDIFQRGSNHQPEIGDGTWVCIEEGKKTCAKLVHFQHFLYSNDMKNPFPAIWRFPKIGVPLKIIHLWMFPYKPTSLGTFIDGNPPHLGGA